MAATTSYLVRKLPIDLWAKVKQRADRDGLSLRAVILTLLQHYAEHGMSIRLSRPR